MKELIFGTVTVHTRDSGFQYVLETEDGEYKELLFFDHGGMSVVDMPYNRPIGVYVRKYDEEKYEVAEELEQWWVEDHG
jgi:hypothetical protein